MTDQNDAISNFLIILILVVMLMGNLSVANKILNFNLITLIVMNVINIILIILGVLHRLYGL